MKLPAWINSALDDELKEIEKRYRGKDGQPYPHLEALNKVIQNGTCKKVWQTAKNLTNPSLEPEDGCVWLTRAILSAQRYEESLEGESWRERVTDLSNKLTFELLQKQPSERLSLQCDAVFKELNSLVKIIQEKKKETLWATRRHGEHAPRLYFVQILTLAYYRRDNAGKHPSDVAEITNAVFPSKPIDERTVRENTKDIEAISDIHSANLSQHIYPLP